MEHLLFQLIKEAKETNPDSEAVKVFEYLIERMGVDIDSEIKDVECNSSNNVYENDSEPQQLIELREALEKGDVLKSLQLGMNKNTRFDGEFVSKLTINFTNTDYYHHCEREDHTLHIECIDVEIGEFDERTIDVVIEDALKACVNGEQIPWLGDQTAKLEELCVVAYEEEGVVVVDMTGYAYEIKAVVEHALNREIFKLNENWVDGLQ
jgi:hypothetical protein